MKLGDKAYGGIYAGKINSHYIICSPTEYELPFEVDWFKATEYCKSIGMELPTKEELNLLYTLSKLRPEYFPNRKFHWYWSSTEHLSTIAWEQDFTNGDQGTLGKTLNNYVRPIKRIKI